MSIKKTLSNMNLTQIADSGQCFRWNKIEENTYAVPAFNNLLTITCDKVYEDIAGGEFTIDCTEEEWANIWSDYLDMDTDYARVSELILSGDDEYLKSCYLAGSGIRILKQDIWEVIISFLISQNNNIKRIRGSIEALCQRAFDAGLVDSRRGNPFFPAPADIPADFDFAGLGLGYRDVYLKKMYEYTRENPAWTEDIRGLNYDGARSVLKAHTGIGPKVADCICLFGLHHVEAFPIDTHVKQILAAHYPDGFDFERYSGVAGIAQQYMFYGEVK